MRCDRGLRAINKHFQLHINSDCSLNRERENALPPFKGVRGAARHCCFYTTTQGASADSSSRAHCHRSILVPPMRVSRAQQWKRNPASVRQSLQLRIMYTRVGDDIHLGISRSLRVSRKIGDARSQHWNSVVSAVAS